MENKKNPIKIAMIMGKMIGGGVESVIMNYYRHIDRTKVQFDFFVDEDSTIIPKEEINSLGGNIFLVPPYQKIIKYFTKLDYYFKKNNYIIIHSNINTVSFLPLFVAKKNNISVRILHNHSTSAKGETKKNFIKYFFKKMSIFNATHFFFPSIHACEWLLGKKNTKRNIFLVKNAIEVNDFKFDEKNRNKGRKFFGFDQDTLVVGNIGRLVWQKNQLFIIQIFAEINKKYPNSKLMIVGNGPLRQRLNEEVVHHNLESNIYFFDNMCNIQEVFQEFDIFLFPSNYEGFGMVAIEAQVSGLPVFCSENVPEEVSISNLYQMEKLKSNPEVWATRILEYFFNHKSEIRHSRNKEAERNGYSVLQEAPKLTELYLSFLRS